jgi:hypothetical protein
MVFPIEDVVAGILGPVLTRPGAHSMSYMETLRFITGSRLTHAHGPEITQAQKWLVAQFPQIAALDVTEINNELRALFKRNLDRHAEEQEVQGIVRRFYERFKREYGDWALVVPFPNASQQTQGGLAAPAAYRALGSEMPGYFAPGDPRREK